MRFISAQKQVSTIFTCRDRIFGFCARRKWFFAIYAKTEGPRLKSCITSINKLDNCGSFEPKYKSLRPSGAEIIFWPNFGWAWPIWPKTAEKNLGHSHIMFITSKLTFSQILTIVSIFAAKLPLHTLLI